MSKTIRRRVMLAGLLAFPAASFGKGGGHGGGKGAVHSTARRSRRSYGGHSSADCSDEKENWFARSFGSGCAATEKRDAP